MEPGASVVGVGFNEAPAILPGRVLMPAFTPAMTSALQ